MSDLYHSNTELAAKLKAVLEHQKMIMVTAESCTGGLISSHMTRHSGSSAVLDRGFVTYSNEAKHENLGVRALSLEEHGAVSEQVAKEMAEGALKNSHADFAISVTGIAGPDGGTDEKPVGLVYIGLLQKGAAAMIIENYFEGDRHSIQDQAVQKALDAAIEYLS